jgi:predicted amidohydrolase YtcJ
MRRVTPSGVRVGADQELTIEEALAAHTIDAARAIHMDDRLGSIEPGKLADLTVVDGDLLGASPEGIRALPIWMTVLGGWIAYRAPTA